ncbi:DedA family protein [Gracilimonas halophila]|uniref:DedA family protein n=1 Tax=Gracilimonas halophila TaxID=1834464 RepID=A0ABW5JKB7_9BACT
MRIEAVILVFLGLLSLIRVETFANNGNARELHLFQDSLSINTLTQPQDTSKISNDSLEKLVPYLDDVDADSQDELYATYVLLIALSTFLSEDLAAIGAGLMAANAMIPFWPAAFAVIIGIFIGDFSLYLAGRWVGKPILKLPPFKWMIKEETLDASVKWFKSRGPYILFASRFIPGSRMPVYISAGILDTGFWTFMFYFGGTVLLWTPIFVWISMLTGHELLAFYEKYDQYVIWVIFAALLVFNGLYKIIPLMLTAAGRRVIWKKFRRLFRK